ncbi:MAG: outer membrane protein assembly factor BamD [Pseudobdellovibrionaceae bacterium]
MDANKKIKVIKKVKTSVFHLILLMTLQASAEGIYNAIKDFVRTEPPFSRIFQKSYCEEKSQENSDPQKSKNKNPKNKNGVEADAENLWQLGLQQESKGQHCKAFNTFAGLSREYPVAPYYQKAGARLVLNLYLAEDYIFAINEGNLFIEQNHGLALAEDVYFIVLQSVNQLVLSRKVQNSPDWLYWALGLNGSQTADNPYLQKLSYKSYLEEYPNGKYTAQVLEFRNQARQRLAQYEFSIADFYCQKKEYVACINRTSFILKWGPGVNVFAQALYKTVQANVLLAKSIASGELSDLRLRELSQVADGEVLDRQQLAQDTFNQAKALYQQMQTQLPNSPWTLKAAQLW